MIQTPSVCPNFPLQPPKKRNKRQKHSFSHDVQRRKVSLSPLIESCDRFLRFSRPFLLLFFESLFLLRTPPPFLSLSFSDRRGLLRSYQSSQDVASGRSKSAPQHILRLLCALALCSTTHNDVRVTLEKSEVSQRFVLFVVL